MGHRTQLGLAINPFNGEVWAGEQGPNGGDEVNIIKAGKNYGWPVVSDGRDYRGPYMSASPYKEGMERPHVVWVPSIALSGMVFYTGDRFPNWKRNLVRRRHARGRDRPHRSTAAHRVQRQLAGVTA